MKFFAEIIKVDNLNGLYTAKNVHSGIELSFTRAHFYKADHTDPVQVTNVPELEVGVPVTVQIEGSEVLVRLGYRRGL